MKKLTLPKIGDDISGGIVVNIVAQVGDQLSPGDTFLELETDKAVLEVPASEVGMVSKILVKDGDQINVGDILAEIEADENQTASGNQSTESSLSESSTEKSDKSVVSSPAPQSVGLINIALPEIGDDITGGVIVNISVEVGSNINAGDTVLELETDKAVLEVPSSHGGTVKSIVVKDGDHLNVGDNILELESTEIEGKSEPPPHTSSPPADQKEEAVKKEKEQPVSVSTNPPSLQPPQSHSSDQPPSDQPSQIYAGPATRKLARELGVDLRQVTGTRRGGRIDIDDVKNFTKQLVQSGISVSGGTSTATTLGSLPLPDFSEFGPIEVKKVSNLRKTIAQHIARAWSTIPHVHQFDEINVDQLLNYQAKYKKEFKAKGSSLSLTIFIIKAMVQALKEFPAFNSSYNEQTGELILKQYYNIGVAVDTPDGLIVPVIKNVDQLSLFEIGKALIDVASKTRERKISPQDLKGAGITLSNLGGIGGTHFNPIINAPEVAIIGTGRNYDKIVPNKGLTQGDQGYNIQRMGFTVQSILPICLAYDHRVIDGADGARFITYLKELLEHPDKLLFIT